jgi:hypothetical protein
MNYSKPYKWPYDGEDIKECRNCGASIYWRKNKKNKNVPITYKTNLLHFLDCEANEGGDRYRTGPRQGRVLRMKKR